MYIFIGNMVHAIMGGSTIEVVFEKTRCYRVASIYCIYIFIYFFVEVYMYILIHVNVVTKLQ